jgi:hypothetical protein
MAARAVSAGPDPAHTASIRALDEDGLGVVGDIMTEWGPERLMVRVWPDPSDDAAEG